MDKFNFNHYRGLKIEVKDSHLYEDVLSLLLSKKQEKIVEEVVINFRDIDALVNQLLIFKPGFKFSFHNDKQQVEYVPEVIDTNLGKLSFLHEYGHFIFNHNHDKSFDKDLLLSEKEAWFLALRLASKIGLDINDEEKEHISKCLQSYIDYVNKRSVCCSCGSENTREYYPQGYVCDDCFSDF